VMVVRKNVLEYIIAFVVVKNKVRLKRWLKKFQIWQSSIVQINLSITSFKINIKISTSFRRSMLTSWWWNCMNDPKKSDLKMSSLNVRTTYHIYYFTFKL
jgi:hypothetical protein